MSIENEIFKRLQKLKSERLAKKENLGAIEDAVNQAKNDLEKKEDYLVSVVDNLNNEIDDIILESKSLAERLSVLLREYTAEFEKGTSEYMEIANELDTIGIPYDNVFSDISSDFNDAYDYAEEFMNSLGL